MASYAYLPSSQILHPANLVLPGFQQFSAASFPVQTTAAPGPGLQPIQHLLQFGASSSREFAAGTKRGSEEMLGQSNVLTNGEGVSLTSSFSSDFEAHDAKKVRLDAITTDANANIQPMKTNADPSKVVHVRGIPSDTAEIELRQMAAQFGTTTNLMLMKAKNQAFIEMADVLQATAFVNHYQSVPAKIRGKQIYLQYSSYKELKMDQNSYGGGRGQSLNGEGEPRTVLHIIVDNLLYPVTIDVLNQIFSRYGQVLKAIIFNKNNQFQALVQFSDPISAHTAKVSLDGQNVYNNCCTLKIEFSKLPSLQVRFNNDKSRDFTNPTLPTGETLSPNHSTGDTPSPGLNLSASSVQLTQSALPAGFMQSSLGAPLTYLTPHGHPAAGPPAMHQFPMPVQLPQSIAHMAAMQGGYGNIPGLPTVNPATLMNMGLSPAVMANMANMAAMRMPVPTGMPQSGCVVIVSNLDEEMVTPDGLFTLFGVYGDVLRVKILFNKKDTALIQFGEPSQAQIAVGYLDKIQVWGKEIKVAPSKHPAVQMPTDMQADGAKLTKDYTNSPLHRFKKKGSKNYQNIFPPSATLHLSNIPPDVSGDLLKTEFEKHGTVTAFKFFEKDHKMALLQMSSVEESTMALIDMHNFQLAETSHLRVSFTKSTINMNPTCQPLALWLPLSTVAEIEERLANIKQVIENLAMHNFELGAKNMHMKVAFSKFYI